MKSFLALVNAIFHMSLRNRQALLWSFLFPALLMLFMSFLNDTTSKIKVDLVGPATGPAAVLAQTVRHSPGFTTGKAVSISAARGSLHRGKVDAALIFSPAFNRALTKALAGGPPAELTVLYANSNYIQAQITRAATSSLVQAAAIRLSGHPLPLRARTVAVGAKSITYLQFVVPGLIGIMIMNSALFAITSLVTRWRERRILKRLKATSLRPSAIIFSLVLNQLLLGFLGVIILVALAIYAFHVHLSVYPATQVPLAGLGLGTFLALGLFLSGVSRDSDSVTSLVNLISLPMLFLSGIWFPVSTLPSGLRAVVNLLPLTYLVHGLRASMLGASPPGPWNSDVQALAVWTVLAVLAAGRSWRWE